MTPAPIGWLAMSLAVVACADDPHDGSDAGPDEASCVGKEPDWGRGGELMLPGTDCTACHREGGTASSSAFTVAGTVFEGPACPIGIAGAVVVVTDSEARELSLATNEAGNFHTSLPVTPPLRVRVEASGVKTEMASPLTTGACGTCHTAESSIGFVWARR
jgi:hypothetical protein